MPLPAGRCAAAQRNFWWLGGWGEFGMAEKRGVAGRELLQDAGEEVGAGKGGHGGKHGPRVPAGGSEGGVRTCGEVLDEGPAGQLTVRNLRREDAGGLEGEAGGEFHAFVAHQLAPKTREDEADGFLGSFAGGVGAFVADLLKHLVVRADAEVPQRCTQIGRHCLLLPFCCCRGSRAPARPGPAARAPR